mmetsp:Transcript_2598/g.5938  ORF Transcript_2598/g.5938 Transcript_2598/m.5938 type:complete len:1000 (-) Transcript_2598:117-3116(-)
MTGISDIARNATNVGRNCFPRWLKRWFRRICFTAMADDGDFVTPEIQGPQLMAKKCREPGDFKWHEEIITEEATRHRWGILVPIRGTDEPAQRGKCWERLENLANSIFNTTDQSQRSMIRIHFGIDKDDDTYDNKESVTKLRNMFEGRLRLEVHFHYFPPYYSGKLCWIWNELAHNAVKMGAHFFVLLGDDIELQSRGWKHEIEDTFRRISSAQRLPFGIGCVAFRDESFEVFPTFPVLHRMHLQIFGDIFPARFMNQHGDPFVFEIYRRWGASVFSRSAKLKNMIGGAQTARYNKDTSFVWRDKVLSKAIEQLARWLQQQKCCEMRKECLDVVVPTFRGDISILRKIAHLRVSKQRASTSIIIVVDNPNLESKTRKEIKSLQSYEDNHWIRVHFNDENRGASYSRNVGMAQSFGDWAVLLDDDVIVSENLLDAYYGAIIRNPGAKILVGHTRIPSPETLLQKGLVASEMTFFYNIARRMRHPSWGVTANICVRTRTQNKVWFSEHYPKTGGGEDVDYCLNIKKKESWSDRKSVIIAVPRAVVTHPFWTNITKQVVGWAMGDVRLLVFFPENTFFALPNWAEWILLLLFLSVPYDYEDMEHLTMEIMAVVGAEIFFGAAIAYPRTSSEDGHATRILVSIIGAWLFMIQDLTRLLSKLCHLRLHQLFIQFDWMDGQKRHKESTLVSQTLKNSAFLSIYLLYNIPMPWIFVRFCSKVALQLIFMFWCTRQNYELRSESIEQENKLDLDSKIQPFVILTWQRTGSNLLCGILHNHQEVMMHNEVFHSKKIHTYHEKKLSKNQDWKWNTQSRDAHPEEFISDLFNRSPDLCAVKTTKKYKAVGFKLFPEHLCNKAKKKMFVSLMADARVKKVILKRGNPFEVYVSMLRSALTGKYLTSNLDNVRVHVDAAEFENFLVDYEKCFELYRSMLKGQDICHISYEKLVKDRSKTLQKLQMFLGVDHSYVPNALSVTQKQSSLPVSKVVENFSELKALYSCTKYSSLF